MENQDQKQDQGRIYRCTLEVRGYELDSYGHVNHAVYISYLEQARWKMLTEERITFERMEEWQRWPIIAQIEASYLKPTFMGDLLEIHTQIIEHRRASFVVEQRITRGEDLVLKAKVHAVVINEKGRPASVPPEFYALWGSQTDGSKK